MAFLGLSGLKLYIALGMALAIVLLLAANIVLVSRIQVKDAQLTSKTEQLELAAGDVTRWEGKATELRGIKERQAAEIRRLESDAAAAAAIGAAKLEASRRRLASLESQNDDLRRKARDHPEDVRDLGPIVRGALPSLRVDVPAGAAAPGY